MMDEHDAKLKAFVKEQVRRNLLKAGRALVIDKGVDFLTARKLSEASGVSVGTIYNLFATMDNFILAENEQTLDELFALMNLIVPEANPYINISRYADAFSGFVIAHPHLWQLLFRDHLYNGNKKWPCTYVRRIKRIESLFDRQLEILFGQLRCKERRLAAKVLEMSLFALSGFLSAGTWDNLREVNKNNICQLLLNTYLAGLATLKRE